MRGHISCVAIQLLNTSKYFQHLIFLSHPYRYSRILSHMLSQTEIIESDTEKPTGQAGNIVLEFRRTTNAQKSMVYERVKIHHATLPVRIKQCDRLRTFFFISS